MRKIKLTWVLPGPAFEVVEEQKGNTYFETVTRDDQSEDRIHWQWRPGLKRLLSTSLREVVLAGARECQEGRGVIAVRLFKDGIPIAFGVFTACRFFGQWIIASLRPTGAFERAWIVEDVGYHPSGRGVDLPAALALIEAQREGDSK